MQKYTGGYILPKNCTQNYTGGIISRVGISLPVTPPHGTASFASHGHPSDKFLDPLLVGSEFCQFGNKSTDGFESRILFYATWTYLLNIPIKPI